MTTDARTRPFTGRHMAAILIAFFGVVIAVNVTMAMFATRTFGGTVVENSYVASQRFNLWLAQGRAQDELGWTTAVSLDARRRPMLSLRLRGRPLDGATVEGVARHPLGRAPDLPVALRPAGAGRYVADRPLPAGRWLLQLMVRRGGSEARLLERVG